MPKLRGDDVSDIDVKLLEETEYDDTEFSSYEGDIPPENTVLTGYVNKMWWLRTAKKPDGTGEDPMIKVLWIAAENEGDLEQYNGLPIWENLVLTPGAKFRWGPFLDVFGFTINNIVKSTIVAAEEDNQGSPIEKVGAFVPGEESDAAWSRVLTKRRRWDNEWQADAKRWLPYDLDEGEEDADDGEADDGDADEDLEDEELEDEEAEEEAEEDGEEEAAPPARGRSARAARSNGRGTPARSARAAQAAATATPARGGRSARGAASRPAEATTARRGAKAAPATRGRGRGKAAAGSADDPPF
jgi:hypothetical protein